MWNLMTAVLGIKHTSSAIGANATLISTEQLVCFYGQSGERLMIFDLRDCAEVERFPYSIPGALPTTRANLLDLANWIPPESVVVLCGADNLNHDDFISQLPNDAHFYVLKGGIKSWEHARLPLEPVNSFFLEGTPTAWTREIQRSKGVDES